MKRSVKVVLALLLAVPTLASCSDKAVTPTESVDSVALSENVCELVPAQIASEWSLAEVSHSTENESNSVGRCSMAKGSPSDVTLNVRLTSYSGGDADSALGLATEERVDACSVLSSVHSAKGTVFDGESSCTVDFRAKGTASTIAVSEVNAAYGVVRIEMKAPESDAKRVESAVQDLMAAVEADFAASKSSSDAS